MQEMVTEHTSGDATRSLPTAALLNYLTLYSHVQKHGRLRKLISATIWSTFEKSVLVSNLIIPMQI